MADLPYPVYGRGSAVGMAAEQLVAGTRVWVTDPAAATGRAFGRIVSVDRPGYLSDGTGFVVRLDDGKRVVTCTIAGRGITWDFAEPPSQRGQA